MLIMKVKLPLRSASLKRFSDYLMNSRHFSAEEVNLIVICLRSFPNQFMLYRYGNRTLYFYVLADTDYRIVEFEDLLSKLK